MDPETYKAMLIASGTIISLLLTVLGYFLNKHIRVIETLVIAVNSLNVTVKLLQNDQSNSSVNCFKTHSVIDSEFKILSDKISKQESAIAEIKFMQKRNMKS